MPARRPSALQTVAFAILATPLLAQQPRQLTTTDYAHAESFMNYMVNPLVDHTFAPPTFLPDGRFWYKDTSAATGVTFQLVDPAHGTKGAAFDQTKLAAALNAAMATVPPPPGMESARHLNANRLPITAFDFPDPKSPQILTVALGMTVKMRCDLSGTGTCTPESAPIPARPQRLPAQPPTGQTSTQTTNAQIGTQTGVQPAAPAGRGRPSAGLSPDKKKQAFLRDWNLYVRDIATGTETQLTTDGIKDYGYATDNAGWTHSNNPILLWSPDSTKIATFQQDQRKTGELYLVQVTNKHPTLETLKYPLAGDPDVTMIERVVIDVPTKKLVRFKMPPDQHRSSICDDIACRGGWDDVQWSEDSKNLAFLSTARDHRQEWLRMANPDTGDIREVFTEKAPKFYESGNGRINWKYLSKTNEFLWFSELSGWGQMYLYDLNTGKLKNQITTGDGNVTQVLRVDQKARTLFFLAVGKEKSRDPYLSSYYRVDFDGKNQKLLTPEPADHAITPSPDGKFFVDIFSTLTEPQTAIVRDANGNLVTNLGRQDISRLLAKGWVAPTPIMVKARDGKTDLYGFLFKPTKMEPGRKYPIVNHVYPGPQTGSCGARTFSAAHGDLQSLAELGFVVVCIDGMGTPWRSKAFHEFYYGDMGDNTIPDQVAGMKDLAARYPFIDLSRAGIYGHSGGGNATAAAMFHFPDFFQVGIAESGNHDNRLYEDDWAEKWSGLEVKNPDGTSSYDSQANQNFAKNLKGHLLLAHGTMDDNVPPNETLIVVDALIKANKDFDLLMIPNVPHGYQAATQYMTRRRWDYFVRYLAQATPPVNYEMTPYARTQAATADGPEDLDAETKLSDNAFWQ